MSDKGQDLKIQTSPQANGIISDFSYKSKIIYLIIGSEHLEIMQNLEVNFVVIDSFETLKYITPHNSIALKEQLKSYKPFFISASNANQDDFINSLKLYKIYFQKIVKNLYLIDLEILKSVEIIGVDELLKHDYNIGLKLPNNYNLMDYIQEVANEYRHEPLDLYDYLNNLLNIEAQRLLNARK